MYYEPNKLTDIQNHKDSVRICMYNESERDERKRKRKIEGVLRGMCRKGCECENHQLPPSSLFAIRILITITSLSLLGLLFSSDVASSSSSSSLCVLMLNTHKDGIYIFYNVNSGLYGAEFLGLRKWHKSIL